MAFSRKISDPLSAKARALSSEIAALEAEIKKLDSQLTRPADPKFRSAVPPPVETSFRRPEPPPRKPAEPVFEEVNRSKLVPRAGVEAPEVFNDLGVRKYDLPALFDRIRNHFRGPTTSNPRLVNYLAAGGVQGLRPLRYERRVARNRFFALLIVVTAVLLGLFLMLKR